MAGSGTGGRTAHRYRQESRMPTSATADGTEIFYQD